MPDKKTHLGIGALVGVGVGVYIARDRRDWPVVARILGAMLGSMAGAALPDALEPALHSWHRGSFHSWGALLGTSGVTLAPPVALPRWMREREAAAERSRLEREALPAGHPDRPGLWLAEMFEHILVAAVPGLLAGYASHLILDATSPRGLPPL